jgi:hypothetical protein
MTAAVVAVYRLGWVGGSLPPSSTASTRPALTSVVVGTWRGELVQSNGQRWSMELHVDEGGRTATTTYPELRCVGSATVETVGADTLRYREHIRSGSCTPDGTITVRPRSDGRLDLYYVPDVGGYTASAVLGRPGG